MTTIPIVQNVDRIIRPKDYDHLQGQLLVTSIFPTIQGEGIFAGRPSMFVRLAGCNFGNKKDMCDWCDTSFQFDRGEAVAVDDLLNRLIQHPRYSQKQVLVITGGEPTLQEPLLEFMKKATPYFYYIQVETNGTQAWFFKKLKADRMLDHVYMCVSPKASSKSGTYPKLADVVLDRADCLKFVISADPNSAHHTVPTEYLHPTPYSYSVYVSPMAVYKRAYTGEVSSIWDEDLIDKEKTSANYAYAAQYAMQHNLILSLQTHLFTAIP